MIEYYYHKDTKEFIKSFSIYSPVDLNIVRLASKYDLYLIGGTAIELWLNKYNIKGWRLRSKNDLDFTLEPMTEILKLPKFIDELSKLISINETDSCIGIAYNHITSDAVDIDLLTEDENLINRFKSQLGGIKLMDPIYLFLSKLNRCMKLHPLNEAERFNKDTNDLTDLLKLIDVRNNKDELVHLLGPEKLKFISKYLLI